MFCESKGSITMNLNHKFKGVLINFVLRPKDLSEVSINSMSLKSLVIDTKKNEERKLIKINKNK